MNLHNIAMVAADTSRTRLYLMELIKNKLLPNHILLLLSNEEGLLPGQKKRDSESGLIDLIKSVGINYNIAPNSDINSDQVVEKIEGMSEKVIIFSGYGGVLLKNKTLETGKNFLHIHDAGQWIFIIRCRLLETHARIHTAGRVQMRQRI